METSSFELFRRRCLGEAHAAVAVSRRVAVELSPEELSTVPEASLWEVHRDATARGASETAVAGTTLLDVKVELARRLLGPCRLCWLRCPVDRRAGQLGACGLGDGLRPYQDFVHLGEELELIPTHAIYLAGCNYRCVYCSDWTHVEHPRQHAEVPPAALSRSLEACRRQGALSVSFIGGLPDVNLPGILEALQGAQVCGPVVWNSNMSATPEAHDLLEGVVDAYVADLKYGSEDCARAGSGVQGSLEVARRNLLRVRSEAYLIVRHLVLPGHVDCCALPTLDWLAANLPGVRVNLMGQYLPPPEMKGTAWDRLPLADELTRARAYAAGLPLDRSGPGRIEGSGPREEGVEAAPVAGCDSAITIDGQGKVVVENLSPELAATLAELAEPTAELRARQAAARPWLEPPR